MTEERRYELIEKSIESTLSEMEQREFDLLNIENPKFKDEVEQYKLLVKGIKQSARQEFKKKMGEEIKKSKHLVESEGAKLYKLDKPSKAQKISRFIPYSIAAILVVVLGIFAIYTFTYQDPVKNILSQAPSLKDYQESIDLIEISPEPSIVRVYYDHESPDEFGFIQEPKHLNFPTEVLSNLYRLGMSEFNKGNYDGAVTQFLEITKTFADPQVFSKIGESYALLGKYNNAIRYFDFSLKLDNNFPYTYLNKGYCLANLNELTQAIENYNLAVNLDSTYFLPYYDRGLAYLNLGNNESAIKDFTLSINYQSNSSDSILYILGNNYYSRALAYINLGLPDKALPDLNMSIKIDPDHPERPDDYFFKGICHFYLEQYEDALPSFKKAQEKGSKQKELLNYLDWTEKIVEERRKSKKD